ncbi:uncharacterized protein At4g06598 [Hevea brasiliensis]|uniref:uncharacterized protein At4g06598 n=1 Tax=Hevea brasiliensis TaxID=3981 RepID=UPI0025FCED8E|nr:uncharacterized protein At4g06598 [Hevea brasiliensis]
MENSNGPSVMKGQNPMLPPRSPFKVIFPCHSDFISSPTIDSKTSNKLVEGEVHHYRGSSDGYLLEQPSWLDELLSEPESPLCIGHHRSSSDSDALLGSSLTSLDCLPPSRDTTVDQIFESSFPQKSGRNGSSKVKKNQEGSNVIGSDTSKTATASKTDSRRSKQQFGRSARLRKLQYIAELERSVQILQAEGSEVSAALHYLDQQVLILDMENRALKQRLDSLSHEQLIKYLEQDMLEREIARLQILHYQQQQQKQKHKQKQKQKQKRPTHYQSKSREVVLQLANLCI